MNTNRSKFWSSGSVPLIEPEFLSSIIAAASDIALVVSAEGKILSVLVSDHTESYGNLLHWEGKSVGDILASESLEKFTAAHDAFLAGEAPKRLMELNHEDGVTVPFPIRYTLHRMAQNDMVLLLGRDMRPIAETQQQLVQAQIALEKGYEARREYDARYRVLLSKTRDAMVFVSVADGKVRDANSAAAALLAQPKDSFLGSVFANVFKDRRTNELIESLMNAAMAEEDSTVALQTKQGRKEVRVNASVFRAAGERVLICRLDTGEAAPATVVTTGPNFAALFREGTDAMLFTDPKGIIQAANNSFLDIVDAALMSDVKGRLFSEFLSRGAVDLGVLIENARRGDRMRLYATKMVNDFGGSTPIEVSSTYLEDVNFPSIGFVIRDSSRLDAVGAQPTGMPNEETSRSVMELVGSASLKEIVAETTDVVEKMCIETAVSLTRNNRVAAAEMLGLSRQSLYVKLRKYGLLAKD